MILYDQNFKFIGLSAETLTFLGYEDLEEFCSMHSDFADLFIKREGYIHKFENFSWIHYILYSGAANKKALIAKKNGGELSVEITIKEVFLNKTYDGLEKIYSVKLINENFTTISKTEVHDQRSNQNSHFSLQNLTKDINTPQITEQNTPVDEPVKETTQLPEPLLNIEKEFSQPQEEEPEITLPEHSGFVLGAFDESPAEENNERFDTLKPEDSKHEPDTIISFETEQNDTDKSDKEKNELLETPQNSFLLFPQQEEESSSQTHKKETDQTEQRDISETAQSKAFELNFDLFKQDEEQHRDNTQKDDIDTNKEEKEIKAGFIEEENETQKSTLNPISENEQKDDVSEKNGFSLELFNIKTDEINNSNSEAEQKTDDTSLELDNETKESLISQIKSDIQEIDEEIKPQPQEKEAATLELKKLLQLDPDETTNKKDEDINIDETLTQSEQNSFSFSDSDIKVEQDERTKKDSNINQQDDVLDFLKAQTKEQEKEKDTFQTLSADKDLSETSQKDNSFEETLKNIFASSDKDEDTKQTPAKQRNEDTHLTFTLMNTDEDNDDKIAQNQQSINKEPIKSDDNIKSAPKIKTQVSLPPLGSLGLSKEEELDFIDEFLNDTVSTTSLIEEYIKIDDFDNIKYSLIKIKSSAEILGFDAMIDIVKSLTQLCDKKDKVAIVEKLNELKDDTKTYREHFATIAV